MYYAPFKEQDVNLVVDKTYRGVPLLLNTEAPEDYAWKKTVENARNEVAIIYMIFYEARNNKTDETIAASLTNDIFSGDKELAEAFCKDHGLDYNHLRGLLDSKGFVADKKTRRMWGLIKAVCYCVMAILIVVEIFGLVELLGYLFGESIRNDTTPFWWLPYPTLLAICFLVGAWGSVGCMFGTYFLTGLFWEWIGGPGSNWQGEASGERKSEEQKKWDEEFANRPFFETMPGMFALGSIGLIVVSVLLYLLWKPLLFLCVLGGAVGRILRGRR